MKLSSCSDKSEEGWDFHPEGVFDQKIENKRI
jgi:hypothetical protein